MSSKSSSKWEDGSLLKKVYDMTISEKLVTGIDPSKKVINFKHPHELEKILALSIEDEGVSAEKAESVLEQIMEYSLRTQHPHFLNQQFHGIDEVGLAAAWITEALNTNQHTYEIAPVFILMEKFVVTKMAELLGWSDGDGVFSAGGTLGNTYAMNLARYRKYPDVKRTGIFGKKRLIAFASDQCHYWITKSVDIMGLGLDSLVIIPTDDKGRMIPKALKEAIKKARDEGGEPFFVGGSAAGTVLGAYDPFEDIADICEQEGLWFHIDACWGGTAILSKTHKYNLAGVERADSFTWNPHKMIGAPLQCSIFLLRHKGLLLECNASRAAYLFQQDKFYDINYDLGDKSFQCGRKADAIKLYMILSFHGLKSMEEKVDAAFAAANYFSEQVKVRNGFRLILDKPQCTNVCFWFIPKSLRGKPETPEWWEKLSKVAPEIKARMMKKGTLMIGYQQLRNKNLRNFFRLVTHCFPESTKKDMDFVLDEIERLGSDL